MTSNDKSGRTRHDDHVEGVGADVDGGEAHACTRRGRARSRCAELTCRIATHADRAVILSWRLASVQRAARASTRALAEHLPAALDGEPRSGAPGPRGVAPPARSAAGGGAASATGRDAGCGARLRALDARARAGARARRRAGPDSTGRAEPRLAALARGRARALDSARRAERDRRATRDVAPSLDQRRARAAARRPSDGWPRRRRSRSRPTLRRERLGAARVAERARALRARGRRRRRALRRSSGCTPCGSRRRSCATRSKLAGDAGWPDRPLA